VPELLAHRPPFGEQVGREQPLRKVVDAAVPLAPRDPEDSRLGQRLEDRPDLVRRAPVPVDRLARLDVVEDSGPLSRIRPMSSSTSGACSSSAPPSWILRERSHAIRYHGSSAVGTIESILLNVSNSDRSSYRTRRSIRR
jgi:hypothetical protein